ncbi:hypothetical protein WA171_005011 [Blastocystis sp. BT1]
MEEGNRLWMIVMSIEIRERKKEEKSVENCNGNDSIEEEECDKANDDRKSEEREVVLNYDIEEDPECTNLLVGLMDVDKYIFVLFKVLIMCLAYFSFHMFFNLFIRPLFISLEERIGMVIAALQEQWCHPEGCTDEDQKTIEAIVKNIKESGRRFW